MPLKPGSLTRKGNPTWARELGDALRAHRESIPVTAHYLGITHTYPLSQRDAAARHGCAQSAASEIECGIRLRPQDYIAYAHSLNADLEIRFRNDGTGATEVVFKLTPRKDTP